MSNPLQIASMAQSQYFNRPADQRFDNIDALEAAVVARRLSSLQYDSHLQGFRFEPTEDGIVAVPRRGEVTLPTHYSFGQSARLLGAPAQWLRQLGAANQHELVADNLNMALKLRGDKLAGDKGDVKVLLVGDETGENTTLQAVTSKTYGRIWDADVVAMTKRIVEAHPEFHNPLEWSGKRGGLYASDRDVFMFFIDGGSIVDGGADLFSGGDRDQLHRGFFVWNSEVGSATMGIAAFLFRMVCGNHMIHGIEGVRLLKIRHTSGGPERFLTEVMPALQEYVGASAKPLEAAVKAAKQYALPSAEDKLAEFFTKKGFTKAEVKRAKQYAETEEGGAGTLWQMQQGFTRSARDLAFIDARTDLERRAGKLFELVSSDAQPVKLAIGELVN